MISKDAIEAALTAHAQWKKRLQDAIATGRSEFQVNVVSGDTGCQFGKWLYGLSQQEQETEIYQKIKGLHAEFHKIAGEILGLALVGKKDEALKKLEHGDVYSRISGKLVLALTEWKNKIG